jgi:hypothetical protein
VQVPLWKQGPYFLRSDGDVNSSDQKLWAYWSINLDETYLMLVHKYQKFCFLLKRCSVQTFRFNIRYLFFSPSSLYQLSWGERLIFGVQVSDGFHKLNKNLGCSPWIG